jgi:hypothetical protein
MKKQKDKLAAEQSITSSSTRLRHHHARQLLKPSLIIFLTTLITLLLPGFSCAIANHRITFLTPRHSKTAYQLNDLNTLTRRLDTGWMLRADEKIELFMHVAVAERIKNVNDIKAGLIFFTTDPSECKSSSSEYIDGDSDRTSEVLFPLTFSKGKSKMRHNTNIVVNTSSANSLPSGPHSTLLVASVDVSFVYSTEKYYTCLYFAKKASPNDVFTEAIDYGKFVHQGTANPYTQIMTTKEHLPFYLVITFYIVLMCFAALFSGLNLGLMSLDLAELSILKKVGSASKKSYAEKIYPLRAKGNLLLCTILFGNVLVNATSTLILGSYLVGPVAAIGSTLLIVIFGEIIPQAVCSRHGLAVGAHTRHITYMMLGLTFVVSYPLSKVLDFFLGKQIARVYSRDKVRELMRQAMLSAREGLDGEGAGLLLEHKQYKLIQGALDFKSKTVKDIMVPLKDIFALDIDSVLDYETFRLILFHGYSRIPVYEYTK